MYQIGNRSLLFVCVTLGFLGMVLVFQTCLQVNRITGDLSQVGAEFIKILVHEFGPSLTAMMLATRVGAGIAAEIGSMVVTEQIDALRMNGVDPVDYLIVPRFLASLVMTGALTTIGVGAAIIMGALTAYYSFHLNPVVFLDPSHVRLGRPGHRRHEVRGLRRRGAHRRRHLRPRRARRLRGRRRRHHARGHQLPASSSSCSTSCSRASRSSPSSEAGCDLRSSASRRASAASRSCAASTCRSSAARCCSSSAPPASASRSPSSTSSA